MNSTARLLRNIGLVGIALPMLFWDRAGAFVSSSVEIVPLSAADLAGKPVAVLTNRGAIDGHLKVLEGEGRTFASVARYVSSDQKFKANVKRFEPTTLELTDWPIDEFMFLIRGRVEITDASGKSHIYGAGEAFVMPKGFTGRWRQLSSIGMYTVESGVWK
jgi:uncharacterized cupin superfamily protein